MSFDHAATDVTVEVFNHCAGTCTGCLLSAVERKAVMPVLQPGDFAAALDALLAHGAGTGRRYRPVMVFGDVPWLPLDTQRRYYDLLAERGMPFGATMTLVEEDRLGTYRRGMEAIVAADPHAVFDITVDPVRLERDQGYRERLAEAMAAAPHLHLQALLSEAVLGRWSPEAMADLLSGHLGGRPVALGFTPALARLDRANYGYEVASASAFAARFYRHTKEGRALLKAEVARFAAVGSYADFLRQTFHVGAGLKIYPVSYTVFGDIILDGRNLGQALGSLRDQPLADILAGPAARRLSALNGAWLGRGPFGCDDCRFRQACEFNGVGITRKLYADHEFRVGSCYGPAGLPQ